MQTFIYADNFRGFHEALFPIRQVNFLVGENSTGKTSVLELIETFAQAPFWLISPTYGRQGAAQRHFLDLVSASSRSKHSFTIGCLQLSNSDSTSDIGMLVTYRSSDGRPAPTRISIISSDSIKTVEVGLRMNSKSEKYKRRVKPRKAATSQLSDDAVARGFVAAHRSTNGFTETEVKEDHLQLPPLMRYEIADFPFASGPTRQPKYPYPFESTFVELAPIRTRPKRTYDAPQTEFSPEGQHTPYLIKKRLASKAQAAAFETFLTAAGISSGLFKSVSVKSYGTGPLAPFELRVDLGKAVLGLENVGYGVSQALPVLVEMFTRPKRTAFTIQQPEVHLHPRAQATVGDLIAQLARIDDKRFFVETHSDFTIDRFRLNIRQGGPISSQVLYFDRKDDGNRVTSIPIDDDGNLSEDQPTGYREFFLNESLTLLT
jgi:hypothetical protein